MSQLDNHQIIPAKPESSAEMVWNEPKKKLNRHMRSEMEARNSRWPSAVDAPCEFTLIPFVEAERFMFLSLSVCLITCISHRFLYFKILHCAIIPSRAARESFHFSLFFFGARIQRHPFLLPGHPFWIPGNPSLMPKHLFLILGHPSRGINPFSLPFILNRLIFAVAPLPSYYYQCRCRCVKL